MTSTNPARTGVTSEVGRLRTVILHRPGHELRRLTPRNNAELLFDGMPWVSKAQDEHDAFNQALRDRGVETLLLRDLLVETLAVDDARREGIATMLGHLPLGDRLTTLLADAFEDFDADGLADVMMAGLRNDELPAGTRSVVSALLAPETFLINPLPNLLFTRDSSVWMGSDPCITSLNFAARQRENHLTQLIYTHHPRFADVTPFYGWRNDPLEGGDVLAIAPGALAIGVGERTTAAGVEHLARTLLLDGRYHTIVAVPMANERAMMHLDTICTMVDVDACVMYPNVAQSLQGMVIRAHDGNLEIGERVPFLEAAADAMGIERLRRIDTGLDPHTAEREQWDDGNNTLALAPKLCVAYERNEETNARLEEEGIEVIRVAGAELGSGRGGPRCMSCPVLRDPLEEQA